MATWFYKGSLMCHSVSFNTSSVDDGLQVDVVFLDFSKAFDRVSHDLLPLKQCNFGISGSLLNWCENYLSHREQRVVVDGQSSACSVVPSGIPQGSLLGPLFFVIFISDSPDVVMPDVNGVSET